MVRYSLLSGFIVVWRTSGGFIRQRFCLAERTAAYCRARASNCSKSTDFALCILSRSDSYRGCFSLKDSSPYSCLQLMVPFVHCAAWCPSCNSIAKPRSVCKCDRTPQTFQYNLDKAIMKQKILQGLTWPQMLQALGCQAGSAKKIALKHGNGYVYIHAWSHDNTWVLISQDHGSICIAVFCKSFKDGMRSLIAQTLLFCRQDVVLDIPFQTTFDCFCLTSPLRERAVTSTKLVVHLHIERACLSEWRLLQLSLACSLKCYLTRLSTSYSA